MKKIEESLMEACSRGLKDAVLFLLSRDVDVNVRGPKGCTPLHEACRAGHTDIVRLLLNAGAVVDGRDDSCLAPLHYACVKGHTETVRVLLEQEEMDPEVVSDALREDSDPFLDEPPFRPEIVDMLREYVPKGAEEEPRPGKMSI